MAAFVGLMIFGPAIVDFWTVGRIPAPRTLLGLLVIGGLSTMMWHAVATALYATNNNRAIAAIYGISAASGLAVLALVTPMFGINGAAAALAIAEMAVVLLVVGRTMAFLDQRFLSLVLAALKPPTDVLRVLRRGS
jgi:O-antigen/teichoic acid export membrane protein